MAARCSGFFLQSTYGARGNFDVVSAPFDDGPGFVHRWRDNDSASLPWRTTAALGSPPRVQTPVLMQSERFGRGRLHIAPRIWAGGPTALGHFERESAPPCIAAGGPNDGEDGVGLIQSNYGIPRLGHLEAIVRRGGRHFHCWRIDRDPWTWHGPHPIP